MNVCLFVTNGLVNRRTDLDDINIYFIFVMHRLKKFSNFQKKKKCLGRTTWKKTHTSNTQNTQ